MIIEVTHSYLFLVVDFGTPKSTTYLRIEDSDGLFAKKVKNPSHKTLKKSFSAVYVPIATS
jgi:hypothetical protein